MTPQEKQDRIRAIHPLVERARRDVTAVKTHDGSRWTHTPLDVDTLTAHVNGGPARGVCYIHENSDVTSVAVLDLDSHKGETSFADMMAVARRIVDAMTLWGMQPRAWVSSGGSGIHLYVIWAQPQDAYTVRSNLHDLLAMVGLRDGAGGVARGEVEVYPRQDRVGVGQYGNQTILPFAGRSAPLDLDLGMALAPECAVGMAWPASQPLVLRAKPDRSNVQAAEVHDLARVRKVLMTIPNSKETDGEGYFWWRDIMFSVHAATGGSAEGLELFLEWSRQHPLHDEKFTIERMWGYASSERVGGIGFGTLMQKAKLHGFTDMNADGFEDIVRPVKVETIDTPTLGAKVVVERKPLPAFERTKEGTILPTPANVVMALRRADLIGWGLATDAFKDEKVIDELLDGNWRPFRDADYTRLRILLPGQGFAQITVETIKAAVNLVCDENLIDTAIIWLREKVPKWDGVCRIDTFFERYFSAEASEWAKAVSRYLWTAMAGRVLEPGCQADMSPILVGLQGEGKTTALSAMVPSMEHLIEVDFNRKEDDLARLMRGALLAEIGELRGFNKKELASIKAFMTRRQEKWVPKFGEFAKAFDRRLVFIGTTNEAQFLVDPTGNRRWLPLNVGAVDVEGVRAVMLQLWAEAREAFLVSGVAWQAAHSMSQAEHEQFEIPDPWVDLTQKWRESADREEGSKVADRPFLTTEMVLAEAVRLPEGKRFRKDQMRAADALKKLGGVRKKVGGRIWGFFFPPVLP